MSEQEDVVSALDSAGVLAGVRWAYTAASGRALSDYDEADGHDATSFGTMRHTYFRDRLDRVFSCKRYAAAEADGLGNLDLVFERLSQDDIDALPRIEPGRVVRQDLHGSPGWMSGGYRFLLASTPFGEVARLPWPQKSETKQRVALQPTPEPVPSLFDDFSDDEIGSLRVLSMASGLPGDIPTFIVAHSLNAFTGDRELVFGRPRLNTGGGSAWWWREDLLRDLSAGRVARANLQRPPSAPDAEPDAPVSLRRQVSKGAAGTGGGEL